MSNLTTNVGQIAEKLDEIQQSSRDRVLQCDELIRRLEFFLIVSALIASSEFSIRLFWIE